VQYYKLNGNKQHTRQKIPWTWKFSLLYALYIWDYFLEPCGVSLHLTLAGSTTTTHTVGQMTAPLVFYCV
jgi:hypothetical protein